jgi:exodeoxyribonuclease III
VPTFNGVRVISAYVPNGQEVGSDKYDYKLRWLDALGHWVSETLSQTENLVIAGDYNIAPEDRDVHDPTGLGRSGAVLGPRARSVPAPVAWLSVCSDAFRLFDQPDKTFSWWDYRQLGFRQQEPRPAHRSPAGERCAEALGQLMPYRPRAPKVAAAFGSRAGGP